MFSCFHLVGALSLLVTAVTAATANSERVRPVVDLVRLDGIVGPASARHVVRGLGQATRDGAQALVVVLDTPGGLMMK